MDPMYFLTIGECGIVIIWYSKGVMFLYEQKPSNAIISFDKEDLKGGFVSIVLLPLAQGVLCVTMINVFSFMTWVRVMNHIVNE
jgi:U3 small nucleolar RNA-associated protein 13